MLKSSKNEKAKGRDGGRSQEKTETRRQSSRFKAAPHSQRRDCLPRTHWEGSTPWTSNISMPRNRPSSLLSEFKGFAFKGNVIDLAVGVIIGAAFGKIITSLVDHIIMPIIGVILPGKSGYQGWVATIQGKKIPYGPLSRRCRQLPDCGHAALFLFIVKFLGWIMKAKKEAPPLTKDQVLLSEIRDLLKRQGARIGSRRAPRNRTASRRVRRPGDVGTGEAIVDARLRRSDGRPSDTTNKIRVGLIRSLNQASNSLTTPASHIGQAEVAPPWKR